MQKRWYLRSLRLHCWSKIGVYIEFIFRWGCMDMFLVYELQTWCYSSRSLRISICTNKKRWFSLQAYLDWSTGIGTSGPITSERRGTVMGVFNRGWGGSWYWERSTEKGPVICAGLGGGASACSAATTGDDDLESFDSVGVVERGGACLERENNEAKGNNYLQYGGAFRIHKV